MRALPTRPGGTAQEYARELKVRFGRELRIARTVAGLTQSQLAARARVSQPTVTRVERGMRAVPLDVMSRLASAAGHQLSVRLYPADGVSLRDSGQLQLAQVIRHAAHEKWRVAFEEPIAPAPDRRAADMVLRGPAEILHVEIERALADFQAQLRAAQLKRAELARHSDVPVRLVLAVPDTRARRRALEASREGVLAALPVSSRRAWEAIRHGVELGRDALLWVSPPAGPRRRGDTTKDR